MNELKKNYSPEEIEDRWYAFWEENGYFKPDFQAGKEAFSIVIPPPNVTGSLHMGHALNATIQDILARWKRMSGHKVLWLPGTDHAGIATQNVVEREIAKEGLDRHKMGREAFIEKVWTWKAEYGGRIFHQLRKIGASCDWSRERFTLDEGLSRAVREVFVRLFDEGLIYRDGRLINWCPRCHTALSDLEVEYEDMEGKLYSLRYPLADGSGHHIVVATTRPETMLGDTAVAVHPEDERYRELIGKNLDLPLTGRQIPIIADEQVDPQFGTGAVKVTPAHDFNDEAMGKRHGLPFIRVISEEGTMSPEAGERYAGLDRYKCRKRVIEDLTELGLMEGEKKHPHSVGHCYRCKTIIEPLLTIQWYVKIAPLAEEAIRVVEDGRVRLIPNSWDNNYFGWMREIKDWCISRQIWWGHQIPVWYCPDCATESDQQKQGDFIEHIFFEPMTLADGSSVMGGTYAELTAAGLSHEAIVGNSKIIRVPRTVKPLCAREDLTSCPHCGSGKIIRDPDVLDTWFSSALWPFSTLGWPDTTEDLKTFYPTSTLVTGFDILFFWVARMMMMGLKFMDEVPFRDVYIHALVRDSKGQKMSKSKGNVTDPLIMIDKFGADAFRFSLAAFAAQGRDVRFSEERVEGYRYFINKLWNATRFILNAGIPASGKDVYTRDDLALPDKWILSRLSATAGEVSRGLSQYRFNDAANSIYHFIWHEFCDWYIELSKPALYQGSEVEKQAVADTLFHVLEKVIRILHPFMPYVTEELWKTVFEKEGSIMTAAFPEGLPRDVDAEREMAFLLDAVTGLRSIRGELNIAPSLEVRAEIKTGSAEAERVLRGNIAAIMKLTRAREVQIGPDLARPEGAAVAVKDQMEIYLPLEGLLDIDAELARLGKELAKVEESIAFLNKKFSNESFMKKAPQDVLEKEKAKLSDLTGKKEKIEENIAALAAAGGKR
ncbi:MAG: valine--tRNA ligase [Thermodesulfovibrionales bacterium]|jgi:valyl-tRNA synthetase